MIVGSTVGGILTEAIGEQLIPLVAAGSSFLAALLILIFIPSDTKALGRRLASHRNRTATEHSEKTTTKLHNDATTTKLHNDATTTKLHSDATTTKLHNDATVKQHRNAMTSQHSNATTILHRNRTPSPYSDATTTTIQRNTSVEGSEMGNNRNRVCMGTLIGLKEIIKVFNLPNVKYLLFIKITAAFPFSLVYSFFSMAVMDYYHLGPRVNGIILAYVGLLVIFIQGFLVGVVTKYIVDPTIIKYCMYLNTMAFLFLVVSDDIIMLCIVFFPLAIGGTISHIVITATITKLVPTEDTGSALGLTLGLHGFIRIIAPSVGGIIFNHVGWPFFGVVGYSMSLFVAIYIVMFGNEDY